MHRYIMLDKAGTTIVGEASGSEPEIACRALDMGLGRPARRTSYDEHGPSMADRCDEDGYRVYEAAPSSAPATVDRMSAGAITKELRFVAFVIRREHALVD